MYNAADSHILILISWAFALLYNECVPKNLSAYYPLFS